MPKFLWLIPALGPFFAMAIGALVQFDPLTWTKEVPAPYADLLIQPVAVASQAVAAGLLGCLLIELAVCFYLVLFLAPVAGSVSEETGFNAEIWHASRLNELTTRWRWYFVFSTVPGLLALWFSLSHFNVGANSVGYWDFFWPLIISTAQGAFLVVFAVAVLWWECRRLVRIKEYVCHAFKEPVFESKVAPTPFAARPGPATGEFVVEQKESLPPPVNFPSHDDGFEG